MYYIAIPPPPPPHYAAPPPAPPPHPNDDDALPTYASATSRDPLPLVARYVPRSDVTACCRVSRAWRDGFAAELWGTPHVFWGMGENTELTSFQLFLRTLSTTPPPSGAKHTHTLSLSTVSSDLYTSLHSTWLSSLLRALPTLWQLHIPSFPHLSHGARLIPTPSSPSTALRHTGLRALLLPDNPNTTPALLTSLLSAAPLLQHIDLSSCAGAAHASVLTGLAGLRALEKLELRALGLKDGMLLPVLRGVGTRLRLLDVSNNALSDATADALLDESLPPPSYLFSSPTSPTSLTSPTFPAGNSRQMLELSIGNNRPGISAAAAARLLKSAQLRSLDVGATSWDPAAALVPPLVLYAFVGLRRLRCGWRVVAALKLHALPALTELVLCAVPATLPAAGTRAGEGGSTEVRKEGDGNEGDGNEEGEEGEEGEGDDDDDGEMLLEFIAAAPARVKIVLEIVEDGGSAAAAAFGVDDNVDDGSGGGSDGGGVDFSFFPDEQGGASVTATTVAGAGGSSRGGRGSSIGRNGGGGGSAGEGRRDIAAAVKAAARASGGGARVFVVKPDLTAPGLW